MKNNMYVKKAFTFLCIVVVALLSCVMIDYFIGINYVINDDIGMRDIASGVKSGTPDGHLVYIKYVLGWILSKLYCANGAFDWYGIFLLGAQVLCWCLICYRIIFFAKNRSEKASLIVWTSILFITHIYKLQWTMCSVICGGTAVFFYLTIDTENKYSRIVQKLITVVLLMICYLVRYKVFWLVAACGFIPVIYRELKIGCTKKTYILSLGGIFACILLGIGAVELVEYTAYNSEEWMEAQAFNKARSQVYDYYGIPDYEQHIAFYENAGISENTYNNLKKYDFVYDPNVNAEVMREIAEYSKQVNGEASFVGRCEDFARSFFSAEFTLLRLIMLLLLICIFLWGVKVDNKYSAFLVVGELLIWLAEVGYIIYQGRFPSRIIYVICLIFIFLSFSLLMYIMREYTDNLYLKRILRVVTCGGILAFGLLNYQLSNNSAEYKTRNLAYDQIKEYANVHQENLYLVPTRSIAGYTTNVDFYGEAYEGKIVFAGGWASHTPLVNQRLASMGVNNIPEDFINEGVYILNWEGEPIEYITNSLSENLNRLVTYEIFDTFETANGWVLVYQLVFG